MDSKSEKVGKKSISKLAGKSLIELTRELEKVKVIKEDLKKHMYQEQQGDIDYVLYSKTEAEMSYEEQISFLSRQENEIMARIEELENGSKKH